MRRADVAIAGDCRLVIDELLVALDGLGLPHSDATRGGSEERRATRWPEHRRRAGSTAACSPGTG